MQARAHSAYGREPMFWAACAFAVGVLLGTRAWRPPLWWATALLLLLTFGFVLLRRRARWSVAIALVAFVLLGAAAVQFDSAATQMADVARFTDGRESAIVAHVVSDGVLRGDGFGRRQIVDVETEAIADEPLRAGLRLSIYGHDEGEDDAAPAVTRDTALLVGQRIEFPAKLRQPRNFGNPGATDFRGYLRRQGITLLASTRNDRIRALPGASAGRLALMQARIRRALLGRMHDLWPAGDLGLIGAMVLGERSDIAPEVARDFQRTGVYHVLVVSGMNVGILAFVIFWLMRRLRSGEVAAIVTTLAASAMYAWLAEAGAPILRATLMLAVYLGARWFFRGRAPLNAVGVAGLALLVADPQSLFDPSFQLTFLAVAAICGVGVPLLERTTEPYRRALRYIDSAAYDFALAAKQVQFRLDLRMLFARTDRLPLARAWRWGALTAASAWFAVVELLLISLLMQISLALPMAFYFHRATVMALPTNLVVVPLAGLLLPMSLLAMAVSTAWTWAGTLLARATSLVLHAATGTVSWLGRSSLADVRVATPEVAVMWFCVAAFAIALLTARRNRALVAGAWSLLAASALWIATVHPQPRVQPNVLEVTAIDVGQGDATLIVTPAGQTMLLDAAGAPAAFSSSFDYGEQVVAPFLWTRGITRLDVVALSHAHSDHIGGMASVVRAFCPRELWLGIAPDIEPVRNVRAAAEACGTRIVDIRAPDVLALGDAKVRVLAPDRAYPAGDRPRNQDSLVLLMEAGGASALFAGDVDRKIERGLPLAAVTLLKVPHNGSNTATSAELLQSTHPRAAVISVGERNPFGHPRKEVLERLAASHTQVFRTDTLGAVSFYLEKDRVQATPALR